MLRRSSRQTHERGATLVEFAFVLPLFILLLFAIIDFGWLFTQFLDVKQGAREGARLAIVNDCDRTNLTTCSQSIANEVCNRTDLSNSKERIDLVRNGQFAEVTLKHEARSLTGMLSVFIKGDLTSKVQMRTEQEPLWSTLNDFQCS